MVSYLFVNTCSLIPGIYLERGGGGGGGIGLDVTGFIPVLYSIMERFNYFKGSHQARQCWLGIQASLR